MHDFLEFKMRSQDGLTYVASVRTDNYTGGDEEVWQAPLRPSRWVLGSRMGRAC